MIAMGILIYIGRLTGTIGRIPGDFAISRGRTLIIIPAGSLLLYAAIICLGFLLVRRIQK